MAYNLSGFRIGETIKVHHQIHPRLENNKDTALEKNVDLTETSSKKKNFASTVTNQLFCPLSSSLIHERHKGNAVILLWAGFNILVQSGNAERPQSGLLARSFILTMPHHKTLIKLETSHSSTAILHCYFQWSCGSISTNTHYPKLLTQKPS